MAVMRDRDGGGLMPWHETHNDGEPLLLCAADLLKKTELYKTKGLLFVSPLITC